MKTLITLCIICMPLRHMVINSGFGYRIHPLTGRYALHAGIDLRGRHDTVFAVLDGRVSATGFEDRLGSYIRLAHGQIETVYGHLHRIFVLPGDSVRSGMPIGITGATGQVTGEHLHFAVRYRQSYINPIKFLYELLKKQDHERQKFQSAADPVSE